MLIATFGPSTGWAGKTITHEGDVFTLEGHGPITAADVMEYDRQGHLVWTNDGTRAWVGSKVRSALPVKPQPEPTHDQDAGTEPQREQMFKPKAVVTVSRRTLVIAGIVVLLAIIAAVAALMVMRSGGNDRPAVQSNPSPHWVKVMSLSGPGSDYWGQLPRVSSAAFEVSGTEQRLESTIAGNGRLDIWAVSTAGPDSGHSDPATQHIGAGTDSAMLYKEPGRYTLEVASGGGAWTVTLYDKK